jgi:RNase P subunit RPR2
MGKENREEAKKKIEEFFKDIENKNSEEIRKIKKLAMSFNIKLGTKKKKFCQKCYSTKLKFRKIKNGVKTVTCENCGKLMRWKIN